MPIKPVETPTTPYSEQLGAAFFEGDSGSKSLKLGLFLYKLKTLTCPSKPCTLPKTRGLFNIRHESFIKYLVPKLSEQSQITSNSSINSRAFLGLILFEKVNISQLGLNYLILSRAESILRLPIVFVS